MVVVLVKGTTAMKPKLERYSELESNQLNRAVSLLIIVVITAILGLVCIEKFLLR